MQEFDELIYQQASYSTLIAWMQKHSGCSYIQACTRVNAELKRYRTQHQNAVSSLIVNSEVSSHHIDETVILTPSGTDDGD